ncbi:MAG: MerR family transcriptional regulator [Alphaproteobacteria bacterium]|nr:MerR family transcriptional regulator [Alphaproteobacteria bacterium]
MSYTVKQLAKLSNVSVRTLHWYDEIGLLKPAYYGNNNYRYYEEEQLLTLQQILFFRELGFKLDDIQEMLIRDDFDKIKALRSHKHVLKKNVKTTNKLIRTIDKTILHLTGVKTMKLEDIFEGFTEEKQKIYVNYLLEKGGVSKEIMENCEKKIKNWTKDDWMSYKSDADKVQTDLINAIEKNEKPESDEVQKIIDKHYKLTCKIWIPDKSSYISLSELYGSHPDFIRFYKKQHPKLLEFLQSAMNLYAKKNLQ